MGEADPGHAFAEAALFEEIFFEAEELPIEQVVRLVDEADRDVGDGLGRAGLEKLAIEFESLRGLAAEAAHVEGLFRIFLHWQ